MQDLRTTLADIAPTLNRAADTIGVPRPTLYRWLRTGVHSTEHARRIIAALARVRPVTASDWAAVCGREVTP